MEIYTCQFPGVFKPEVFEEKRGNNADSLGFFHLVIFAYGVFRRFAVRLQRNSICNSHFIYRVLALGNLENIR